MEQLRKFVYRVLHPGKVISAISTLLCAAALIYVFISKQQETVFAYIVYALTTYSLAVLAISLPKWATRIKTFIYKNKLGNKYMTDASFRAKISLYTSLSFNITYAILKLVTGIHYSSFWYGADALYYIVLSIARLLLLLHIRKNQTDLVKELKLYRLCGYTILLLNTTLISVVYQIINQGMRREYPGLLIFAVATYTFYCISISVVNMVRYYKLKNPARSAQKTISFVKALFSMFALQTAMFASFNEDIALERTMNLIVGICVCFVIFCIAVFMVVRANKAIKKIRRGSRYDKYSCG